MNPTHVRGAIAAWGVVAGGCAIELVEIDLREPSRLSLDLEVLLSEPPVAAASLRLGAGVDGTRALLADGALRVGGSRITPSHSPEDGVFVYRASLDDELLIGDSVEVLGPLIVPPGSRLIFVMPLVRGNKDTVVVAGDVAQLPHRLGSLSERVGFEYWSVFLGRLGASCNAQGRWQLTIGSGVPPESVVVSNDELVLGCEHTLDLHFSYSIEEQHDGYSGRVVVHTVMRWPVRSS